ncbi:PIN domain-containing protein [Candidatus Desantisbacteria bacterium]|nr:PIN domain-containing protein [Candidatus Desantisbacteria bacterium]
MKYLLDTDTMIYYLKGEESVKQKILMIGLENISISIITLFELYYGAYNSKKIDENIQRIDKIKEIILVFGIDSSIFHHFGKIKSSLRKTGKIIGDFDLIIGITVLSKNMILVTNNIEHFSRIEGIVIENWYKDENNNIS